MQVRARAHLSSSTGVVTINIREPFDRPITLISVSDFSMTRSYGLGVTTFKPAMHLCLLSGGPTLQIADERQYFASLENNIQVLATTNLTQIVPSVLGTTDCVYRQENDCCKKVSPSRLIGNLTFQVKEADGGVITDSTLLSFVLSFM